MFSPTAQRMAWSFSSDTSVKGARLAQIAERRVSSSTVSDTLTSDVAIISTGVSKPVEHLEDRSQESMRHQHSIGTDVYDRHTALARQGI